MQDANNASLNKTMEEADAENGYDKNVRIVKSKFYKFWKNKELRDAWRQYVFSDCCQGNVNALFIAIKILEKVVGESITRKLYWEQKKKNKEQQRIDYSKANNANAQKFTQMQSSKPGNGTAYTGGRNKA